jgi:hypothetical protein
METIGSSETSVATQRTTRCHIPEDDTLNIRTVLILCNRLCKLSISTIHGQPVAQHAMLRNTNDREWAPIVARFIA